MEDQIGTVLHWSNQKEPKQVKRKVGHQEEPGWDSHFSCYSSTLKPIQAQPSEPYSKKIKKNPD